MTRLGQAGGRASRTPTCGSPSSGGSAGATSFHTVIPNTMVTASEWIRLSALFTMPGRRGLPVPEGGDGHRRHRVLLHRRRLACPSRRPCPSRPTSPRSRTCSPITSRSAAAVDVGEVASARHADLMRKHFDTITARNSWKFGPIHPARGHLQLRRGGRHRQLRAAERHDGAGPHPGLAPAEPGLALPRRGRRRPDADAGEQGADAAAAGVAHPGRGRRATPTWSRPGTW